MNLTLLRFAFTLSLIIALTSNGGGFHLSIYLGVFEIELNILFQIIDCIFEFIGSIKIIFE